MSDKSFRASSGSGNWPGACWTGQPASSSPAHLHIPVGEQQVHDDVGAQQLHAVQSPLQASQLLPQLLPAEPLPRPPDVLPNGLPEVATNAQSRRERENGRACPSTPGPPLPSSAPPGTLAEGGPHYQESVGVASSRRASRPTRGVSRASVPTPAWSSPSARPLRRPASPHSTRPVAVTT